MQEALKLILEIQDYDMKMLRLMRLKQDRLDELNNIESLRTDLYSQQVAKEKEIKLLSDEISLEENKIVEIKDYLKKLEAKQASIKKVDEFNALNQEMNLKEKERIVTEQKTSDLIDKKNSEEEILEKIKDSLSSTEDSSKAIEKEIKETINKINEEGRALKEKRDVLVEKADPTIFKTYLRLLNNKKDRVLVPLENRTCSGCHIALTAQHENLVRKGERLIFCEHCSRILYWVDTEDMTKGSLKAPKRRRRKTKNI